MATQIEHTDLARLQAMYQDAAKMDGSGGPFWEAVNNLAWEDKDGDFYHHVMRMAWMLGAAKLAREIGAGGLERYPDHPGLTNLAAIIAPGVARSYPHEGARPNHAATHAWFDEHAAQYKGQWVAVHAGSLMGTAPTLKALMQRLKALDDSTRRNTLVTRIL